MFLSPAQFPTMAQGDCDENRQPNRLQAECPVRVRHAQSLPEPRNGYVVPEGQILRSTRFSASEIRDAPVCRERRRLRPTGCGDVRVFANGVVSDQDSLRVWRISGVVTTATWSQITLKKTEPQINSAKAHGDVLHEQYELLRQQALSPSQPGHGQGMIVLLSRGMCAWIHTRMAQPTQSCLATVRPSSLASVAKACDRAWLLTLTALVLGRTQIHADSLGVCHD